MSDSEIYAKAAELLMEDGHCKGNLKTAEGRRCALGALRDAEIAVGAAIDVEFPTRYQVLGSRAAALLGGVPQAEDWRTNPHHLAPIALWNDMPETTAEDVILLFKECAHEGEAGE